MPRYTVETNARIVATGSFLPERVVTNSEIPGLEGADESVRRLLGAIERRAVAENEACSDIIVRAAQRILADAQCSPLDLDRIIVSATLGDFLEPSTASVVQAKLGARCPAVDIGSSCVGWVAGMDYAIKCLATGEKRILVMAGTVISHGELFKNPMHRAIFGDGAGGALVEADPYGGFLAWRLWTDGRYYDVINMPHQFSLHPERIPMEYKGHFFMGSRQVIFEVLSANIAPGVEGMLTEAGLNKNDIDIAFIHQPSKLIFEEAVKTVGIPRERIVEDYERYGNTVSAELPISFDENVRSGRVKRGNKVLMVTYGAGFSGGGLVFEY
jgi:3-oxoacyl-[acyl-carrier-protein] synthase-3